MTSTYAEELLEAVDVCRNCLSIVRVERIDPFRSSPGLDDIATHYERHREHTDIGYGPSEQVKDSKGVFCECGVEEARERVWDPDDVSQEQFKELTKNAIASLETKGVSLNRRTFARVALQAHRDGKGVDHALAVATDAAITAAAAGDHPPAEA